MHSEKGIGARDSVRASSSSKAGMLAAARPPVPPNVPKPPAVGSTRSRARPGGRPVPLLAGASGGTPSPRASLEETGQDDDVCDSTHDDFTEMEDDVQSCSKCGAINRELERLKHQLNQENHLSVMHCLLFFSFSSN